MMVGSHNFHNYSKGYKARDPKSRRYILDFKCEKASNSMIRFIIDGQSFIYHQIRKMIGVIIEIFLNDLSPAYISNTFYDNQIHVLLAPPHGLYLKNMSFDSYNKKQEIPQKIEFKEEEDLIKIYQENI